MAYAYEALERWMLGKNVSPYLESFLRSAAYAGGMEAISTFEGLLPRLANSRGTPEQERRREYMATDFVVRVQAPRIFQLAGLTQAAAAFRAIPPITGPSDAPPAHALVASLSEALVNQHGWDLSVLNQELHGLVAGASPQAAVKLERAVQERDPMVTLHMTMQAILMGMVQRIPAEVLACAHAELARDALQHLEEVLAVTEQAAPLLH